MLTPQQEKWIAHLSNTAKIKIIPFDSSIEANFQKVKQKIQNQLGKMLVEHHGASSLGISGQDEIDVYMPVSSNMFESTVVRVKELFGKPKSFYPLQRARFVTAQDGKHVDVFVINADHRDWKNLNTFESYLHSHKKILKQYEELKEQGNGLSVREYYRRKNEFLNAILAKAKTLTS